MASALRRKIDEIFPLESKETSKEELKKGQKECAEESRQMRKNLTEQEIDKILKDSFPASDPPSWY